MVRSFVRSLVRWCPPFLFVLHYSTNFLKFFPPISLTLSLSSGLTSENVSKKNSPQEAHVNARSKQSTLWEIVNELTNSIVSTYAQGRLLQYSSLLNITLRKRTLSPVRLVLEDSSKRSFMLFVFVSLQLGSII